MGELTADYDGRLALGLERNVWKAIENEPSLGKYKRLITAPNTFALVILEDIDLIFPRYADAQDHGLILVLNRCLRQIESHQTLLIGTTRQPRSLDEHVKSLFQASTDDYIA